MTGRITIARYALGRWLVHLGIRIMPAGRARADLTERLWAWRMQVETAVTTEAADGASGIEVKLRVRPWSGRLVRLYRGFHRIGIGRLQSLSMAWTMTWAHRR